MRQQLTQLLSKMEGNDKLEQLLADVLSNTDKAKALAKQMGIDERPSRAPATEETEMSTAEQAQAAAAARPQTDGSPEPARPGHRRHPAADRPGGRSAPRTTSTSSSTRSSSPARSSPRTSRRTSSTGSARSTRSSPPSSTRSCTTPTSRSSKATWRGLHYLVHQTRDRREPQDPRPERHQAASCSRTWRRPSSSTRARCSRRSTRKSTASSAASRTACSSATTSSAATPEDVSLLKMISNVAAAAHAPFVAAASPKMFNIDSFTELANPRDLAKIFDSVEYAAVEVVPRDRRTRATSP